MDIQFDNNSFANFPKLTEIKVEGDAYIPGDVDFSRATNFTSGGHPVNTQAEVFSGTYDKKCRYY